MTPVHGAQAAARAARWAAYGNVLRPGVHKLNVFWNTIEDSPVGPADAPLTCPAGYRMVRVSWYCKMASASEPCWRAHMQL